MDLVKLSVKMRIPNVSSPIAKELEVAFSITYGPCFTDLIEMHFNARL
jgi:hypothetical protein